MHRFLLHNDRVVDAGATLLSPGQVGLLSGWGVFSTIRVFDGVLFAWERHWSRMTRDAELLHVPLAQVHHRPGHLLALLAKRRDLRFVLIRFMVLLLNSWFVYTICKARVSTVDRA